MVSKPTLKIYLSCAEFKMFGVFVLWTVVNLLLYFKIPSYIDVIKGMFSKSIVRENKQNKTGLVVFVCGGGWMGKEMKRNEVSSLITYCMIQLYVSPIISNLYSSMGHGITFVIKNICFNIVSLSPILVIF